MNLKFYFILLILFIKIDILFYKIMNILFSIKIKYKIKFK